MSPQQTQYQSGQLVDFFASVEDASVTREPAALVEERFESRIASAKKFRVLMPTRVVEQVAQAQQSVSVFK